MLLMNDKPFKKRNKKMKHVGVISKYRESFIRWQKDTFDNIKILYFGKYIFEAANDTRYISIISGRDLRGFIFDDIIELDCAKENPQYKQILTLAKPSLRPKFQPTDNNIEENHILSEIEYSIRKLSEIYNILKNKKDELFR